MGTDFDTEAFVAFEAAGFSRVAAAYRRHFGELTGRVAEPLLDAAGVGDGSRVLDLASGPGQVAALAATRGATVLGLDVSPEMVEMAGKLQPGVEFREGDAHDLPLADASFDAVVANFLVPHLADHARAVGEMARVLVPGGRLALSTWAEPRRSAVPGALFLAVQQAGAPPAEGVPPGPPFYRYADDTAFAALLSGAGLTDVAVDEVVFTYRVPSAAVLWDGLLEGSVRASAQVRGQTLALQEAIRRAFDDLVEEHQREGALELPIAVKIAAGRRPG